MALVCRCGHQLESHRPPKLMPCTSTRLGEPLDEKLEKICTRPGEIVCEEHVREVVWVAPVAHDEKVLVGNSPVERDRQEEKVVVVRGVTRVDETHPTRVDRGTADQRCPGHDETPDPNEL